MTISCDDKLKLVKRGYQLISSGLCDNLYNLKHLQLQLCHLHRILAFIIISLHGFRQ